MVVYVDQGWMAVGVEEVGVEGWRAGNWFEGTGFRSRVKYFRYRSYGSAGHRVIQRNRQTDRISVVLFTFVRSGQETATWLKQHINTLLFQQVAVIAN
ncbi:hypothetical protein BaRGS_00012042 [Batillaria attramentaria]|uniref:Uncharacterized protein n=1 Tax=Batillaria attramentaria TaxID=370345 RepID=A0ABD0LBD0_9CAEN